MKILVCSLLYAVIAFADPVCTRQVGHSSQLESKTSNGDVHENQNNLLYIASLQMNRTQLCGAGMFQLGFLLSSGRCVRKIEKKQAEVDVVMSDYDLDREERLKILDLGVYRSYFGILKVQVTERIKDIGNTITFPLLTKSSFRITDHGNKVMLCGWNPTAGSGICSNRFDCRTIWVETQRACTLFNYERGIDYRYRHHCGHLRSGKKISLNDQGNLVTKRLPKYSGDELYIIGIAVGEFDSDGRTYARFIKIPGIYNKFAEMLRRLGGISNAKDINSHIDCSSNNNTGTHQGGHPSQLESKTSDGDAPGNQNDLLYIASLRMNRTQLCGAGMFQLGFLLSSGKCVRNIEKKRADVDVVMSHYDLDREERLKILDLDVYRSYFGILKVQVTERFKDIGNTITFPLLTKNSFRIMDHGNEAMLCGWNPTAGSEICSNRFDCRTIWVKTQRACTLLNYERGIDYRYRHHCGHLRSGKKLSLNDEGNLVTKRLPKYSGDELYIIGIAVGEFDSNGQVYARFIQISGIYNKFEQMLRKLGGISNARDSDSHIDRGSNNNTGNDYRITSSEYRGYLL